MSIVPISILQELVIALGAALALANVAVVVRERRRGRGVRGGTFMTAADPPIGPGHEGRRPNMRIVALNIVIGTMLAVWGLASLLTTRGGS